MRKLLLAPLLVLVGCGGGADTSAFAPIPPSKKDCKAILTWERPIERTDGTEFAIDDIEKFTIYVNKIEDVNDRTLILVMDITDASIVTWEFSELTTGPNYFYMTVTDTEGRTSTYSNIKGKNCT